MRATRSTWPDGVLRQRAAPPLHVRVDGCGQRGRRAPSDRSATRDGDELGVGALQRRLLAVPADRGAQQDQVRAACGRTHAHLSELKVAALIVRPLDRRHEEARRRAAAAGRAAASASVTMAMDA